MRARSNRCGRSEEALTEYRALSDYFVGAEARVRYGAAARKNGPAGRGQGMADEVLRQLRRSPAHVRKAQAEWIAIAEKIVRA